MGREGKEAKEGRVDKHVNGAAGQWGSVPQGNLGRLWNTPSSPTLGLRERGSLSSSSRLFLAGVLLYLELLGASHLLPQQAKESLRPRAASTCAGNSGMLWAHFGRRAKGTDGVLIAHVHPFTWNSLITVFQLGFLWIWASLYMEFYL